MDMNFAVSCPLVRRSRLNPVFGHRLAHLIHASFRTRLAAVALASSLGLHLHQVGRRTCTSKLLSMPSTQLFRFTRLFLAVSFHLQSPAFTIGWPAPSHRSPGFARSAGEGFLLSLLAAGPQFSQCSEPRKPRPCIGICTTSGRTPQTSHGADTFRVRKQSREPRATVVLVFIALCPLTSSHHPGLLPP